MPSAQSTPSAFRWLAKRKRQDTAVSRSALDWCWQITLAARDDQVQKESFIVSNNADMIREQELLTSGLRQTIGLGFGLVI